MNGRPRSGFSDLRERRRAPAAAHPLLRHLYLIEQIGVTVQHFERLDHRQRRPGLAVLVAREGISIHFSAGPDRGVAQLLRELA